MKIMTVLLPIILLPALLVAQTKPTSKSQSLVFDHVTVIDMTGTPPKPNSTVVVVGDRITAIGKTGTVRGAHQQPRSLANITSPLRATTRFSSIS